MDFQPAGRVPQGYGEIAEAATGVLKPLPAPVVDAVAPVAGNGANAALNVLFGYIPTEVLTLYVALLTVLHNADLTKPSPITTADWVAFWCFMAATPIVSWAAFALKLKNAQKPLPSNWQALPIWEMSAATIAYFAWAFALPSTPFAKFVFVREHPGFAGFVVLVTSVLLGFIAPLFQRPLVPEAAA